MSALIRLLPLLPSLLALAACHSKSPAAPPLLPALSRPVLALPAGAGPVRVPAALVVQQGGVPGVFVLTAEHIARFRMVRPGKEQTGQVEILAGLSGDETLVAGDLRDVHDGSPITSVKSDQ